jgi:hypothetical protein
MLRKWKTQLLKIIVLREIIHFVSMPGILGSFVVEGSKKKNAGSADILSRGSCRPRDMQDKGDLRTK